MKKKDKKIIILGSGGHAMVLLDIVKIFYEIRGFIDPNKKMLEDVCHGLKNLGDDSFLDSIDIDNFVFANGIGMLPNSSLRKHVFDVYQSKGAVFPPICHTSSITGSGVIVEDGVQLFQGTIIQRGVSIGQNTIINTGASIDHDSTIGKNCHIAPGVTICGNVVIQDNVFIGAGSTVIQGIKIGKNSVVGAGCTIKKSLQSDVIHK